MIVINHIKDFRTESGLSQEQLAIEMDVSRQTINAIETSKYNPSLELSLKLAKFFGVTMEKIFQLEEENQ